MQCYLHDETAPKAVSAAITAADGGAAPAYAVPGGRFCYRLDFDEKLSVAQPGTATVTLNGTRYTSAAGAVTETDGKTQINYTFTLPGTLDTDGTVELVSVNGLSATDEAGNTLDENSVTGAVSGAAALTFYGLKQVVQSVTGLTFTGESTAIYGQTYTAALAAAAGYTLPTSIEVFVGGEPLAVGQYTYNTGTGAVTVPAAYVTGYITIRANGVPKQYTVSFEQEGGAGGTASVTATFDAALPEITPPQRAGYTFGGYFTAQNGGGEQYYTGQGAGIVRYTTDGALTLYAKWTANTYTVRYDANKPANASGDVKGSTGDSVHTYDAPQTLTENGFTLTGWTFAGWAAAPDGEKLYDDGQSVTNLSAEANGTATLYAVWEANEYTVNYAGNKPDGASGEVKGSTAPSSHAYDTASALTDNGFTLTGWTFAGWNTQADGEGTPYADGQEVGTLVSDDGGSITLYAVWTANTYTVAYNANRPDGASGNVTGSTDSSAHTYDTASVLTDNGFTLTGWTFAGWAAAPDGEAVYENAVNVSNLTAAADGTVTLYAVWTANTYTIAYNANRPDGASGNVTGSTAASAHTYDTASALTDNGFTLTGWTFTGWNTRADGKGTSYADGAAVENLTAEADGTVTLYAVWTANGYTITLNAAGGSNSGAVDAIYDSVLKDVPALPARHGYNFLGYFDKETGGTQYYGADGKAYDGTTYTTVGNLVLYAQWSPVTYTIELYSGGTYVGAVAPVTFGELMLPSAQSLGLARDNYDFVGWNLYDEQNWAMYNAETAYAVGLTGEQDGVVVLFAAWQEKPLYALLYDAGGGTGAPAMIQVHEDETVALSSEIPVRAEYTFLGWAETAAAETPAYDKGGAFTMGSGPVTLYAVWRHNGALTYDAGEGAFVSEPPVVYPAAGESVALTTVRPARTGFVFLGWAETSGAEKADYLPGGTFVMPEDGDAVLYAVWQKESYAVTVSAAAGYTVDGLSGTYEYGAEVSFTVTGNAPKVYINGEQVSPSGGQYGFTVTGDAVVTVTDGSRLSLVYDACGGTGAPVDVTAYEPGAQATVAAGEPVRTGYEFLGWATSAGADTAQYHAGDEIRLTTDVVLCAVWRAHAYTVAYDAAGGAGEMENGAFTYGTEARLAANVFTMPGHTFVGWAAAEGGAVVYGDRARVLNLTAADGETVTLYAVWEETVSSVRLDTQGGTGGGSFSAAFGDLPETSALTAPARAGYRFLGYCTGTEGEGAQIFDAAMAFVPERWDVNEPDVVLYAAWAPIVYSVVYMNGGAEVGEPQVVRYGESFALKTVRELGIQPPENSCFAGWATYPDSASAVYTDGQTVEYGLSQTDGARVYLYAVFAENPKWRVSYDANGGVGVPVDGNTYYAGENVFFPADIPERYGYVFLGWSGSPRDTEADYPYSDGAFTEERFAMPDGGATLYAVWEAGDTLQSQTEALEKALSALEGTVDSVQSTAGANAESIAALTEDLAAAQAAIDGLDATYATDAALSALKTELENSIAAAESALAAQIKGVQDELAEAVETLNAAIGTKADAAALEKAAADLAASYAEADALLRSDFVAADTALKTELTALIDATDAALSAAVEGVEAELNAALEDLRAAMNAADASKADTTALEAAVTDLTDSYAAADALLRSDFAAADAALKTELTGLIDETADTLSAAVEGVEADLNAALEELRAAMNAADAANLGALQAALNDLDAEYKAADALLSGGLTRLEAQDAVIGQRVDALEAAYKAADEALMAGLNALQTALEELRADLDGQDAALGEKVDSLAADNNDAARVYGIVNIALGAAAAGLIVWLVVRIVKTRKAAK